MEFAGIVQEKWISFSVGNCVFTFVGYVYNRLLFPMVALNQMSLTYFVSQFL